MRKISATQSKKAEVAIRNVFEAGCEAWNQGDLDGYLAGYWDSSTTIWISSGSLTRGKTAIVAAYRSRFSTPQQMGQITLAELEIEVQTTTDAAAFGRWMLVVDSKASKGFFTVQLRKIEDTWFYVSDHSSASV